MLKLLQWHKISLHLLFACISLHQLLRLRSVKALVLKLLQLIFYETAKLYEMFLSRLKIHKIFIEFSTLSKNRLKVWYIFVFPLLSFCLFVFLSFLFGLFGRPGVVGLVGGVDAWQTLTEAQGALCKAVLRQGWVRVFRCASISRFYLCQ